MEGLPESASFDQATGMISMLSSSLRAGSSNVVFLLDDGEGLTTEIEFEIIVKETKEEDTVLTDFVF